MADINEWDAGQKLKCIKVRLTGKAQTAFQCLPEAAKVSYDEAKKVLQEWFEPSSRQSRCEAEFQTCMKQKLESWADFVDNLKNLVDKAYLELEEAARERLVVNQYLQQLEHLQVAFSVKQKRPAKLDEEVSATLEMEAYSLKPRRVVSSVQGEAEGEGEGTVEVVGARDLLTAAMERLTDRLERLENQCALPLNSILAGSMGDAKDQVGVTVSPSGRSQFWGKCWQYGGLGHMA